MTVAVVLMVAAVVAWMAFAIYDEGWRGWWEGLAAGAVTAAVIGAVWFVFAVPVSNFNRHNCERVADGYGLDEVDWSFRFGCRVVLPSGQLVPEGRIRITSDGHITAVDD